MSYTKIDIWSKQSSNGRSVEYLFFTLSQSEEKMKSLAYAKVSGVLLEPIRNLASDLKRSQVEALFEDSIKTSS